MRWIASGPTTVSVSPDGSDSNDGLTEPVLTLQRAWQIGMQGDLFANPLTISVADGPAGYFGPLAAAGSILGATSIGIIGDETTPDNCIIAAVGDAMSFYGTQPLTVAGFKLSSTAGNDLTIQNGAQVNLGNMDFGAAPDGDNIFVAWGYLVHTTGYAISGGALRQFHHVINNGVVASDDVAISIADGVTWGSRFLGLALGLASYTGATFSGGSASSAPQQWFVHNGGVLRIATAPPGVTPTLPGNSAGNNAQGGNIDDVMYDYVFNSDNMFFNGSCSGCDTAGRALGTNSSGQLICLTGL